MLKLVFKWLIGFVPAILKAIGEAERKFPERKTGEQKEEYAISVINDMIDIPILNEKAEEDIFRFLIKIIVQALNNRPKEFDKTEKVG